MVDYTFILRFTAQFLIPLGLIGRATDFTNVSYDNGHGETLYAYLAKPPNYDPTKSYPAALVLHAWNGMSEEPVYFADLLAQQGFIVLAPDLFRNIATCEVNIPWNIATTLLTPQERMDNDIDAAVTYLTGSVEGVDSTRVFSGPGFCFGGSQALNLSIRRAMAGTITLYGANIDGLQDAQNNDLWGELGIDGTKVLGIYGADDDNPSPDEARGFQRALNARNISNNVTIYDGVGHAFVNPKDHRSGKSQPVQAWDQVVSFMKDIVSTGNGVSRRALDLRAKSNYKGSSWAWMWDHTLDLFQRKGHFSHLRHNDQRHKKVPEVKLVHRVDPVGLTDERDKQAAGSLAQHADPVGLADVRVIQSHAAQRGEHHNHQQLQGKP
jgi:carboxymethylenebutenolidase